MQRTLWILLPLAAVPAAAQDNAVSSASDAFGERAGIEQSGLYTESQVRGFDLNDSGAYRIDDAYFSRAAALDDTVLAGVRVRVGVNAARLSYPAPSGVVNYRLREAGPKNEFRLGVGFRDFGTQVIQGDGSLRAGDFSFAGGVLWRPVARYAQGYKGDAINAGGVGAWDFADGHRLRVFGSVYRRGYDGDYAVLPAGAAMPPKLKVFHQYSPAWAYTQATNSNIGALYDGRFEGFTVALSAFHSVFDMDRVDYTLITSDPAGHATATTYRTPDRAKTADSLEARVSREFMAGGFSHLVTASARSGRFITGLTSTTTVPLGSFLLPDENPPARPEIPWSGTRGKDTAAQVTASAGYGLAWRDQAQIRFAAHRTRYDKTVLSVAGARNQRINTTTHYNASALVNPAEGVTVFGSWVTGLEEAGTAPAAAINRDEVLPPVETEQFELGVRGTVTSRLTVIGAVFDVSKPSQGFRADKSFGIVGKVRHRGIEASITGKIDAKTNVVLGAVAFQPRVTGPLVDAGTVGARAPGISGLIVNANVERQIMDGWSVDAAVSHLGKRWANTANTFQAPAITTVSLGARARFTLAGRAAEFRILGSNLTGVEGYTVAPAGTFSPIAPRSVRAVLTLVFAAER